METTRQDWRAVLDATTTQLAQLGERGWIVGGCLRDALLGRPVHDVDLAVTGEPLRVAHALLPLLGGAIVPLKRQTVRLVLRAPAGAALDFSALRGGALADDLRARDYTLNALALPLSAAQVFLALLETSPMPPAARGALPAPAELVDLLGGYADLRARRLVAASEHTLRDDPLRILRAARLAADLDLTADEATLARMREAAPALTQVAPERVGIELTLLFHLATADRGWHLLRAVGALLPLFPSLARAPGIPPEEAVAHLVATQAALAPLHPAASADLRDPTRLQTIPGLRAWYAASDVRIVHLRWGALAHALTPHPPASLAKEREATPSTPPTSPAHMPAPLPSALAASAQATATAVGQSWPWARHLLRAETLEPPAWRRFFAEVTTRRGADGEEASVHAIVTALACQAALAEEGDATAEVALNHMASRAQDVLAGFLAERERWLPPPLLTGVDLVRVVGIPPGPRIGQLLAEIRAAQLEERITSREEALRIARRAAQPTDPYAD
jgi:tRNA nucleotidyltransferase/poly(A) polymerase